MIRDEEKKEYLVQVTIVEARHLKGKNDEGLSNPFVKIQCIDLVPQATNILYSTLTPIWNQSFTFSNVYLSKADLQKGELTIEVWSKNNFFSNSLIGTYAIGLYTLYKNANHEFYNCWLTLTSPEFETEAQGYLLVHCFIIGSGDKPPIHSINDKINNDEEEDDEELNLDNMNIEQLKAYQEKKQGITVLGKPNVIRKSYQLSVYIFKAENLVNMENQLFGGGKTDPFISCRAIGLVQKTKTVKNNNNPLYNQKILFPCYFPVLNEKIILRMWHSNIQDDFIADIPEKPEPNDYFNINKLIVIGGRMPAKWINLYSIPPSERNVGFITNFVKKKHPREGTYYMGRVLLSLSLLPKEKPLFSITNCNPFYVSILYNLGTRNRWI